MARVRVIHWKANEPAALLGLLRAAGHTVEYDEELDSDAFRAIKQSPPDAIVIDLSRRPSHGREVATFLRGHKATRSVPLVFVDGEPAKVEAVRKVLPDAVYTSAARVRPALGEALSKQPASPVVPVQMMDRYAGRSASQKLGIGEGATAALIDPPRNYATVIGALPAGARLEETPAIPCPVTLWFVGDAAACRAALPRMRGLAGRTRLWVLWPKLAARKDSGVTQQFLRESAAAVGLVDYKICSVDKTWSAMLFARRKSV
jgi:CheY-like chemotaxis protein